MGIKKSLFNIALLLFFFPSIAFAEGLLPWPKHTAYEFSYLGASIGKLILGTEQTEEKLSMRGKLRVAGVARLFSDLHNSLSLDTGVAAPDGYARQFEARYHKGDPKDKSYIRLKYDHDGNVEAYREGVYDMDRRDPIAMDVLAKAHDPLSAVLELRSQIYHAVQQGKPSVKAMMYDGKRLYQFDVTIGKKTALELMGKQVTVQHISLKHKVAGGLKPKEKKRAAGYQFPPADIYFTADQNFMPVYGKQDWKFGSFEIVMQ